MQHTQQILAQRGLTLSRQVLKRLHDAGIVARPGVCLEYQRLPARYVVRGVESGGSVMDLGRFVTFCSPDGAALPYLHPIDSITVNGVHAVVVAPVLVRIEVFRSGRTYQLLITEHQAGKCEPRRRPSIASNVLFRGVNGFADVKATCEIDTVRAPQIPKFWSRSGEELRFPAAFSLCVAAAVSGAHCVECSHAHFLMDPARLGEIPTSSSKELEKSRL